MALGLVSPSASLFPFIINLSDFHTHFATYHRRKTILVKQMVVKSHNLKETK
jgi:hypothetical protein